MILQFSIMKFFLKNIFVISIPIFTFSSVNAQCNQNYNWTTWQSFSGTNAVGIINNNGQSVNVTMTSNYPLSSTPSIYNYPAFSGFNSTIPNLTVPKTTWSAGAGGITSMCFNQIVTNPVLLLASLGRLNTPVTLHFSIPYLKLYDGGGMTYTNDTTIIGEEGYAILLFSGNFSCVTIYSTTPEDYTNITWGLNPPLFPVSIIGNPINCDNVKLTATGGVSYLWTGGISPNSSTNTFYSSGTYFLTVTDGNGCIVKTSQTILVKPKSYTTINNSICQGQTYLGHNSTGIYVDTLVSANGCDSIRTLNLIVNEKPFITNNQSICDGQTFLGHGISGIYIDTIIVINGCDSIIRTILTVIKNCEVYFPSAFTPNNDSKNDVFRILNAHNLLDYNLLIYNRWGQKVFETKDYNAGWNGIYNGVLQTIGVYVWYSTFKLLGRNVQMKGTVLLIR